jgi:hypothetical protein
LHATKLTNFVNKKSKHGPWGQTTYIWAKPRELGNKKAAGHRPAAIYIVKYLLTSLLPCQSLRQELPHQQF